MLQVKTIGLESVADLIDTKKLFPLSKDYINMIVDSEKLLLFSNPINPLPPINP